MGMIMILLAFYKKKTKHFSLSNSCYPPNFFLHFLSLIPFFCSKLFFNLKKKFWCTIFSKIRLSLVVGLLHTWRKFVIWREALHQLLIDVLLFLFHSLYFIQNIRSIYFYKKQK